MPSAVPTRATASQVVGEALLTVGAVLLLFAFYEAFWTNLHSQRLQSGAHEQLEGQWVNPRGTSEPQLGDAFALLRIPAFGADYAFAVVEGVDEASLLVGPGHYPGTQLPGQPGNFAVAGHRVGKGAPFNDLGQLSACDAVVVETQTQWVTYRVLPTSTEAAQRAAEAAPCLSGALAERVVGGDYAGVAGKVITTPRDTSVIAPLPGREGDSVAGLAGVLTLTTCHPQFSNAERMIIHAIQTEVVEKSDGVVRPRALQEES
ncbi:Sortase family protein [Corynebacterium capitovis DSM 44611]|uniref:class E sortase n=1 Tax=Corynebacterium capitovis TaxID=131081 RepID=UPI00036E09DA|nr:class E sortase [Corynebacterium capitovis]WKD58328.1 Sortase family protein [Corynebacterium capitovis DSM 44611]